MIEKDIDALFRLPLAEFTNARNSLAAQLKKAGQPQESERVKALAKPPISAWAVNQLYWNNREAFDRLIEAGERFRQAQASQLAGRVSEISEPRDARRDAVSELSRLAAELLRESGHNAAPDTMRRITVTLEAMSIYASLPDSPCPGRLTEDVDPPGFEALAALIADSRSQPTPAPAKQSPQSTKAAEASLAAAERTLSDARARVEGVKDALKAASAAAREADKERREAEGIFRKALAASEEAAATERRLAAEAKEAAQAVENAAQAVKDASRKLG